MWTFEKCAVIVAHPDDETLWAGGTMLMHPEARWTVVTLCRAGDSDRAAKFYKALETLGAKGFMGDMDDSPDQTPLPAREVQHTLVELVPPGTYDLVITHGLWGEYTRHLRHEETGKAVLALWNAGRIAAKEVWRFAYEDDNRKHLPRAVADADMRIRLPDGIWQQKYDIITQIYGFAPDSFEAKATPHDEAFWSFKKR